MKKNNKIWLFSLIMGITLLTLNGCKKSDENNNPSNNTPQKGVNSLTCKIDGASYTATSFNVSTLSGKVGISGMNGSKNLILWLPDPFTTGSHSLSIFGDYMGQYTPGSSSVFSSESGTIVITEYVASNGKIKGTFNFEASDGSTTLSITNGQFEVYK